MGKRGNPPPEAPAHEEGTWASPAAPSDRQKAASDVAPVVVTRLGGKQRIFPVGMPIRVGRDPSAELVSANPRVTVPWRRVRRARSYLHRSVPAPHSSTASGCAAHAVTDSVILHLGDPATGERWNHTPAVECPDRAEPPQENPQRPDARRCSSRGVIAAAAVSTGVALSNHRNRAERQSIRQ